jgi:AcrR family transcriptional regulator
MGSAGDERTTRSPRRRGRPPGQRSAETRDRILRAARLRFSEAGYARTSLADIAREAGITPRAIYHYVDSKPDLFRQAAELAYGRFTNAVVTRVMPSEDTRGRLHDLIDVFRSLYAEDPTLVAFLSQAAIEAKRDPELAEGEMVTPWGDTLDLNHALVAVARLRGDIAPDIDPAGAAALLEVIGSGLTLVASKDRAGDYTAMLDVLDRLVDGTLFADRA